jgi:hypothetical protein
MKKYRKIIAYPKPKAKEALDSFKSVVISEKIDGANASFKLSEDGKSIECFSRNNQLNEDNDLRGFYDWVMDNVKTDNLFPHVIYFGEWLVKHKVGYKKEAYNKFYLYDLYSELEGEYQSCYNEVGTYFIQTTKDAFFAPVRYAGLLPENAVEFIQSYMEKSTLSDGKPEGVVVKDYAYVNRFGEQTAIKFVNKEFKENQTPKKRRTPPKLSEREKMLYELVEDRINEISVQKFVDKMIDESIIDKRWKDEDLSTLLSKLSNLFRVDVIEEVFDDKDLDKDDLKFINKKISYLFVTELKQIYFKG